MQEGCRHRATGGARRRLHRQPWRIALTYIAIGVAWILGSDYLVEYLVPDSLHAAVQAYKGMAFVLVTGTVLFLMLRVYRSKEEAVHEELALGSERYREFFDQNLAGAFELDSRGHLLAENPSFRAVVEMNEPGADGPFGLFLKDQELWERLWHDVASGQDVKSQMAEFLTASGRVRRCELRLFGIRHEGRLLGARGFLVDHTALLELRESMTQRERLEAVGRLAGGVAHDFNNILTAIMGYSEWLESVVSEDSPAAEAVQGLKKSAEKAGAITRQLLVFSAKNKGPAQVINVNEAVKGMSTLLQRLLGERVRLQAETCPEPLRVRMDPTQFDQMMLNLVVNARDATPGTGTVTVTVNPTSLAVEEAHPLGIEPGEYALVSVTDTGVGMTPEVLAHAFEPFFTTKEQGKGTGLGLSTVFGAVKGAGGHVMAESEVGKGTVFRVYLPMVELSSESREMVAARSPAEESEAPAVPSQPGGANGAGRRAADEHSAVERRGERNGAHLEGSRERREGASGEALGAARVLVVEDSEEVREMMVHVLESEGYEVLEASDGREADLLVASAAVDLALIDVSLPAEKGTEVAVRVRAKWPQAEIVFTSGHRRNSEGLAGLLEAGDRLLEKPFTPGTLASTVYGVLHSQAKRGS